MQCKKGFFLLSFLLYLVFFSIAAACICHMISFVVIPSIIDTYKYSEIIALHVATDRFIRDIRIAQQNKIYIQKKVTSQKIIFNNGEKDIKWCIKDNKLERCEGVYDKKWIKKNKSIIAKNIAIGTFIIKNNPKMVEFELSFSPMIDVKYTINSYVSIVLNKNNE